jgi:recombination protein RecA
MNKVTQALMERINKAYGNNTIVLASQAVGLQIHRVSSGSFGLDMGLGGGFCYGRIHLIVGKESSGKTALMLSTIANVQKQFPDRDVSYVAGPGEGFNTKKAQDHGVKLDHCLLINPDSAEQAGDVIQETLEDRNPMALVVDSWASLIPTAEYEGEMGDSQMGKNALCKNKIMRKIVGAMKKDMLSPDPTCLVLITNHITSKLGISFGDPDTDPGGVAKNFFSSIRIKLVRIGKIFETIDGVKTCTGITVQWNVSKNKTHVPFKQGTYNYYFIATKKHGLGIDQDTEIYEHAKLYGFIKQGCTFKKFKRAYLASSFGKRRIIHKIRRVALATIKTDSRSDEGTDEQQIEKHTSREADGKKNSQQRSRKHKR